MLGPVRFEHMENCAREVCRTFRIKDELEESIATLGTLDDMLELLRGELSELSGTDPKVTRATSETKRKHDYKTLLDTQDLAKAKRLITARENSIKSVKNSLQKAKTKNVSDAAATENTPDAHAKTAES